MKKLLTFVSLVLISMAAIAQVSSNNLIIQGSVTSTISTFPISNWPVTITGLGMTSTVYTDMNGFYSDTILNGSETGPNQLFIVQTLNCDSSLIMNTVSNNQGTVDVATVDFQICAQNSNTCMAMFNAYIDPTVAGQVVFQSTSSSSDTIASYNWTLDGISISTSPVFNFIFPSNNGGMVCLTITSYTGCSDMYCQYITLSNNATCLPYFNYQSSANNALDYTFTNTTTTTGMNPTYYWYFGDGANSSEASPTHVYNQGGTYSVCLQVITDQCQNTICQNITVVNDTTSGNGCIASFTYVGDSTTIEFNNNSYMPSYPVTFTWNFNDGSFSNELFPVHTFNTPGVYQVCLDLSAGNCSDSYCLQVYVGVPDSNITCNASIQYSYVGDVPNPSMFPYQFYSAYSGDIAEVIHSWVTSDAQTSSSYSPLFSFAPGTYTICHSVFDVYGLCSDSTCISITVVPDTLNGCTAMFTSYISNTATNEVAFGNMSSDLNASFIWQFADGTYSNEVSPFHTFDTTGVYQVCLDMSSGSCSDSYCLQVYVGVPDTIGGLYLSGVVSVGSNVIDMGSVKLYSLDTISNSVELIGQYPMNNMGSYIFTNLSEGIYLVRAGLSDSSSYYNDYVPTYFGSQYYWFDAETIYLTQSGDFYNISLIYGSNPGGNGTVNGSIDDGPFRLSNPALSTLMSPVLGAQVVITDLANVPQRWVRTDNSGAFSISDLAYGTYRLMADEPGMTCLPIEFTLSEQTPGVTIDLVMGDAITGIVSYETTLVQGDVYPNPSNSMANLNVELMKPASLTMTMTSITGQVMWTQTNSLLPGKSSVQIPVRGIADGLYFLSIYSDEGQLITSRKMQVLN